MPAFLQELQLPAVSSFRYTGAATASPAMNQCGKHSEEDFPSAYPDSDSIPMTSPDLSQQELPTFTSAGLLSVLCQLIHVITAARPIVSPGISTRKAVMWFVILLS